MKTLEEQLELLQKWPTATEFSKPDQGSNVPYLSGDLIQYKLNAIFGPTNWGWETISWPKLVEIGDAAFYIGEYEVWFRFADNNIIKRQVSGLVPLRGGANGAKTNIVRMGIGGCITDAIKEAAATLGPALGLGINDESVRATHQMRERRTPASAQPVAPTTPTPSQPPTAQAPAHNSTRRRPPLLSGGGSRPPFLV